MSLIKELYKILEDAKTEYEALQAGKFSMTEISGAAESDNMLALGDNAAFMKHLIDEKGMSGKINLIYIDPPFFSKSNYDAIIKIDRTSIKLPAYHDTWENGMEDYLRMLCVRFYIMRDLLADDGCFFLHLDWHIVHYAKVILDDIFGEKNFINEIIWNYKSGGTSKRHFSRKHDTLLFYAKTNRYYFKPQMEKSYNRGFKPYRFKGVKEYKDELGWYTMVNMKDVWQIDMVGRTSAERTGYATQKPESLLLRILESCTKEGDWCADFFGGSGSLAAVANRMGRKWISCDIGSLAFVSANKRLLSMNADFVSWEQENHSTTGQIADINIKIELNPIEFSNKVLLRLTLLSYNLSVPGISDALSLIDYWSVDFHHDGKIHRPAQIFFKERVCEKIGDGFDCISLRFADVLGNRIAKQIDFKGNRGIEFNEKNS